MRPDDCRPERGLRTREAAIGAKVLIARHRLVVDFGALETALLSTLVAAGQQAVGRVGEDKMTGFAINRLTISIM
jgi:hypothetical protein